ncbi:class I SAM-dependent methyltransferase [Nostoc sp. CHAB 5844]|nr:class I SAM-dependent methyltransferase [Nostoc sp. CHAB 5844]
MSNSVDTSNAVESFYNNFYPTFINDYIYGNDRIERQFNFFLKSISPNTSSILIIGCGSGQGAHFIANKVAKKAKILAIDISKTNIRLAEKLFAHKRIEYRKVDVTTESIEGKWDVIIFPDVYEHIPIEARPKLHLKLNELLTDKGKIIFTVPSPGKQAFLYEQGEGLQVIDEFVTLEDLVKVTNDVSGVLTYFNMISVWNSNDYIHAIVERGANKIGTLTESDYLPIKTFQVKGFLELTKILFLKKMKLGKLWSWWWKRRLSALLSQEKASNYNLRTE